MFLVGMGVINRLCRWRQITLFTTIPSLSPMTLVYVSTRRKRLTSGVFMEVVARRYMHYRNSQFAAGNVNVGNYGTIIINVFLNGNVCGFVKSFAYFSGWALCTNKINRLERQWTLNAYFNNKNIKSRSIFNSI